MKSRIHPPLVPYATKSPIRILFQETVRNLPATHSTYNIYPILLYRPQHIISFITQFQTALINGNSIMTVEINVRASHVHSGLKKRRKISNDVRNVSSYINKNNRDCYIRITHEKSCVQIFVCEYSKMNSPRQCT